MCIIGAVTVKILLFNQVEFDVFMCVIHFLWWFKQGKEKGGATLTGMPSVTSSLEASSESPHKLQMFIPHKHLTAASQLTTTFYSIILFVTLIP